jgi:hypothetical protein
MFAFLNHDVLVARLCPGFYYFLTYCVTSVFATQLLDYSSGHPPDPLEVRAHRVPACLSYFLLFTYVMMFLVGFVWALTWPILSVRFLFHGRIVVGESRLSVADIVLKLATAHQTLVPAAAVVLFVLVVPLLHICLSVHNRLTEGDLHAPRWALDLAIYLWEWSMLDVFALALFTSLFAFNSFDLIRANAPWGFYCVLMGGMSAFDLAKAFLPSVLVQGPAAVRYSPVPSTDRLGEGESSDVEGGTPRSAEQRRKASSVVEGGAVVNVGFFSAVVELFRTLGPTFFLLKALSWGIFFLIWYLNSGAQPLDLKGINDSLNVGLPHFITTSLQTNLPDLLGNCSAVSSPLAPGQCQDTGPLYHSQSALEITANYLGGLRSIEVKSLNMTVPSKGALSLVVAGSFKELYLSLFIGQCITPNNLLKAKGEKCDTLWDRIHR